jgi:hypothetical protein
MRALLVASALFCACHPQPYVAPDVPPLDLAVEPAGPPVTLLVGDIVPGRQMELLVAGGTPGTTVYLAASLVDGNGPCPPLLNGDCLGIRNPILLGSGTIDTEGRWRTRVVAPNALPSGDLHFQAAAGPDLSPVVTKVIGQTDGCPDEALLDLGPYAGAAGAGYDDPTASGSCNGTDFVVTSNGIPHYTFVPLTPNGLDTQAHTWEVPQNPTPAATVTEVPLLGTAGFAVNGLPFFGPNEGPFPDPYGDPVYNGIVDACLGHTAQGGQYHYHALLAACFNGSTAPDQPSPIVGFASDGFPIYGKYGCVDAMCTQIVEFRSGYVETGDPTTYA